MLLTVMNTDAVQMSTLSEELSLMLSCLRESQLQAAQYQSGLSHCGGADGASSSESARRGRVDAMRRRYDVCFTRAEWRMTELDGQIGIADLLLANFLYTKLNYDDDSGYHQLELGAFKVGQPLCLQRWKFMKRILPCDTMRKRGLWCQPVSVCVCRPSDCHVPVSYPDR